MSLLIAMIATTTMLLVSGMLLASTGRRRRRRPHARRLAAGDLAALEQSVGDHLALLVAEAVRLRDRLEDLAASGREMLVVERYLGGSLRRPLWRQIDDANFGHELDGLRRATLDWLARFDTLPAAERRIVDNLGLDAEPVRALVGKLTLHDDVLDRRDELTQLHAGIDGALRCLRRLESDIAAYRGGGYR